MVEFIAHRQQRGAAGALLAMEMGTGKTRVAIEFLASEAAYGEAKGALIVAPRSVVSVWEQQFSEFWPRRKDNGEVINQPAIYAHRGGAGARGATQAGKVVMRAQDRLFVLVINYEALARPNGAMPKFVEARSWDVIIADEAHRLKSPSGKASNLSLIHI